jgi:predicted nucleic-acid-binding protein
VIAVDTNILVRLVVEDQNNTEQKILVKNLLKEVKKVNIPQIVQSIIL